MAKFYEKYLKKCRENNTSPTAAAVACGFSKAAPSGWKKRGNDPTEFTLYRIAEHFKCDVSELKSDPDDVEEEVREVRIVSTPVAPVKEITATKKSIAENSNGLRSVPLLGTVAAGMPIYAEENIQGYVPCTKDMDDLFALSVHGDSMDRDGIHDGDTVIVHKQSVVDKGDIAVVCIDGDEATIKRVIVNGSVVVLMPNSTNPENQPQIYNLMEHRISIEGKVVQSMHDF